ncbi:phage tail terminator-like protein [uncultured Sphingomonas sp.]|uniref:tail completion protein gp17 n=1 Tax=uncultured Sphingomonas sp. TaxID=158754 RepID=UPI0025F04B46|nr:phage tail terminator-like protein [uncultured Sphingomonas sp.]
MIRQTAITDALKEHLASMPERPETVWENEHATPGEPPYLTVASVRAEPFGMTLDGIGHEYTGFLTVNVVANAGTGTRAAYDLAERIAAHFHGAEIPADGGQLRISRQPQIMDGYQDGARYRVPVSIRYRLIA